MKFKNKLSLFIFPSVLIPVIFVITVTFIITGHKIRDMEYELLNNHIAYILSKCETHYTVIKALGMENVEYYRDATKKELLADIKNTINPNRNTTILDIKTTEIIFSTKIKKDVFSRNPGIIQTMVNLRKGQQDYSLKTDSGKSTTEMTSFAVYDTWNWLIICSSEKNTVFSYMYEAMAISLSMTILFLIVCFISIYRLLNGANKSLGILSKGTQVIIENNFDIDIKLNRNDEFGMLAHNFNDMAVEIKKIYGELSESEKKFKRMIEKSPLPMSITDQNQDITFFNDKFTELFGYTLEDVSTAEKWWQIAYPDEKYRAKVQNSWMDAINKAEATKTDIEMQEWDLTIKDGTRRRCEFHMVPLGDVSLIVMRDITDRKQLEEKLRQAQKMESIGTLAGGIAHDFNNILFPIVGHTEMLLEDVSEDSPFRASLNEVYTGALRASELVKQILTFSRQESSELKQIKMQPIIKEALKLIRSTIPTTIYIKQNIDPKCGAIKADPTQIHQIVMNLTTNAYHAMGETGGELKVGLKQMELETCDLINSDLTPGQYACLTVADTGTGIDKEITQKIFDPFFTTKAVGKGTGMGLSVVHGIVAGIGGAIRVYSEPDKGTEFYVYFPIEKSSFVKHSIQTHETIQYGTETILLVDDEDAIITMEEQMLERLGYQVTSRTSSIEALEVFRGSPDKFDLVITDMAMPNMPGDKLSAEFVKLRPDIPILLCTGFSETMSEEKAASLGIKGFLLKPIVMKDLSQKIREVLDENKV